MISLLSCLVTSIFLIQPQTTSFDPHIYFSNAEFTSWKFEKYNANNKKIGTYIIKFQGENKEKDYSLLFFVAQGEEELGSYKFDNIGVYDDDFGGYIIKEAMKQGDRWQNFSKDGMVEVLKNESIANGKSIISIYISKKEWKFKKIEIYESRIGLISVEYFRTTNKGDKLFERWKRIR